MKKIFTLILLLIFGALYSTDTQNKKNKPTKQVEKQNNPDCWPSTWC